MLFRSLYQQNQTIDNIKCEAFTGSTTTLPRRQQRHEVTTYNFGTLAVHYRREQIRLCNDNTIRYVTTALGSSFYDKFEDFDLNSGDDDDDDDDDDEEDEYEEMDQRSIAEFKSKMSNLFDDQKELERAADNDSIAEGSIGSVDELIEFARKKQQREAMVDGGKETVEDWAKSTKEIRPGTVLVANPRKFCDEMDFDDGNAGGSNGPARGKDFFAAALGRTTGPAPSLLAKFGLTQPPPRHLGADRQADLLPVVIVVSTEEGKIQGVLLNRRTGYLLGDLEQPAGNNDTLGGNDNKEDMAPILEKFWGGIFCFLASVTSRRE